MRTVRRTRDPARDTTLTVVLALARDEDVSPGDVIMLEDIGAALSWLVTEGFLRREPSATSEPCFSFNREREAEARVLISGL